MLTGSTLAVLQGLAFLGPSLFLSLVCKLGSDTADNEKLTIGEAI